MFKMILTWIGGAALLAAMSIDTLAVIGRYTPGLQHPFVLL